MSYDKSLGKAFLMCISQEHNRVHPWLSENDCLEKCVDAGSCPEKTKDDGKRS